MEQPVRPNPGKSRACLSLFISFAIIFGLVFFAFNRYEYYLYSPVDIEDAEPVKIEIQKGETVPTIIDKLLKKDLISSRWAFFIYLFKEDKTRSLQAGKFTLLRNQTIPEMVEVLAGKKRQELKITIPEGYTIALIDQLLAEKEIIEAGDLLQCAETCDFTDYTFLPAGNTNKLEGYLFPDTYFIFPDEFSAEDLIIKMLNTFEKRIEDMEEDIEQNQATLDEFVNMASMIEKESRAKKEKSIVSGILWKRLNEGIHLGVDATMRYYLNDWENPLTIQNFQLDTSYNTRKYLGLPKTPICNPGLDSLEAAVHPEKSTYFYYLHDKEGKIHYGVNLDEHNSNKWKYLR